MSVLRVASAGLVFMCRSRGAPDTGKPQNRPRGERKEPLTPDRTQNWPFRISIRLVSSRVASTGLEMLLALRSMSRPL